MSTWWRFAKYKSPGEILSVHMNQHGLTQTKLSKLSGISRRAINEICGNKRSITTRVACIFGKLFDTPPYIWLYVQLMYDIDKEQNDPELGKILSNINTL